MARPKPITLTQTDPQDYEGYSPQPFTVVGDIPGAYTGPTLETQAAPAIDPAPADAEAVATDLQALVNALIATGLLTEP